MQIPLIKVWSCCLSNRCSTRRLADHEGDLIDSLHETYGTFQHRKELVLTRTDATSHTQWKLPEFFHKEEVTISYHPNNGRLGWKEGRTRTSNRVKWLLFLAGRNIPTYESKNSARPPLFDENNF